MSAADRAWRAGIVDDEPLARDTVRLLLEREQDFVVVGESSHGAAAIAELPAWLPDVLFLDIQMPEAGGFEVIQHLEQTTPPLVVFVTAFERFALQAFEAHAFDYLLKPFSDERFGVVVRRVRQRLLERTQASAQPGAPGPMPSRSSLLVRDGSRTLVVPHDEIVWIEAEDYCARIHLQHRTVLVRESLRSLMAALPAAAFVRVHRSAIARIAAIRAVQPMASGDQRLTLSDGTTLRVSRTHRASLLARLSQR